MRVTNVHSGCTVVKPATSSVVSVCTDCSTSAPAVPVSTETEVPATTEAATDSETPVVPVPETTSAPASETEVSPVQKTTPAAPIIAPYPSSNGTTSVVAPVASGTGAPTESATGATPFEGAATAITASGAGLLAIFGLVALL